MIRLQKVICVPLERIETSGCAAADKEANKDSQQQVPQELG